jgi:hypothetical protein
MIYLAEFPDFHNNEVTSIDSRDFLLNIPTYSKLARQKEYGTKKEPVGEGTIRYTSTRRTIL